LAPLFGPGLTSWFFSFSFSYPFPYLLKYGLKITPFFQLGVKGIASSFLLFVAEKEGRQPHADILFPPPFPPNFIFGPSLRFFLSTSTFFLGRLIKP